MVARTLNARGGTMTCLKLALVILLAPFGGASAGSVNDVIATVGNQPIRLSEIDMMINSSDIVGIKIPAPGTQARNEVRLTLLDKIISADLLYLDALRKHLDTDPVLQRDVDRFAEAILASLYRQEYLVGDLEISEEEIKKFYHDQIKPGTPFSKDLHLAIEARLRKAKFQNRTADLRERLRAGVSIRIRSKGLDPEQGKAPAPDAIVASVDDDPIRWSQAKRWLKTTGESVSRDDRMEAVNRAVDNHIAVRKARAAGLEQDPRYLARVGEFKKVRLVNLRRQALQRELAPSDAEIRTYFEQNREQITVPEVRRIQMVVLDSKQAAADVKQKIDSGEITIYQAAKQYSIDPNAAHTLGEIGWVQKGSGFPALDKLAFSLPPGELGGPVESPAGWHLVKVLDNRPAHFTDLDDRDTWRKTRRMLLEARENEYIANLRKTRFDVSVYSKVLDRLLEEEAARLRKQRPVETPASVSGEDLSASAGAL